MEHDAVNHPRHYTSHPSGIECLQITRLLPFDIGNAVKYVWRADLKNGLEDLRKAEFYLADHLAHFGPKSGWTLKSRVDAAVPLLARVVEAEENEHGAGHPRPDFFRFIALGKVDRAWAAVGAMIQEAKE